MRRSDSRYRHWVTVLVALTIVGVGAVGCSPVRARRSPAEPTGFLSDYSQLGKVQGYDFLQMYVTPGIDWSEYHAIHLESVTLWVSDRAKANLTDAEQQLVTDVLYKALYDALSARFLMAEHPGPQTIELRAALSQVKGANVPLNTITTVVPQLRVVATLGGLAADTAALVGSGSIEIEGRDGIADRLLLAAVDSRAANKRLSTTLSKWSDFEAVAKFWGEKVAELFARQGVQQKG